MSVLAAAWSLVGIAYRSWNNKRSGRQGHQGASSLCNGGGEDLLRARAALSAVYKASEEEAHTHNQQQVGENRAKHRGLHDLNLTIFKSNNADLWRALADESF